MTMETPDGSMHVIGKICTADFPENLNTNFALKHEIRVCYVRKEYVMHVCVYGMYMCACMGVFFMLV